MIYSDDIAKAARSPTSCWSHLKMAGSVPTRTKSTSTPTVARGVRLGGGVWQSAVGRGYDGGQCGGDVSGIAVGENLVCRR